MSVKKSYPKHALSRRNFLKRGCAVMGSLPMLSTLANLAASSTVMASNHEEYKALVCVFQHGGNDSFNMLVPWENSTDNNEYGDYANARGTSLTLPRNDLLPISDPRSGRQFAINSRMPNLRDLYNQGDVAFLANVGSLVEYATRDQVLQETVPLPLGLFSHSDQQLHWHTSHPQSRQQQTGWGGRMLDIFTNQAGLAADTFLNISVANTNLLQTGHSVAPYVVNPSAGAIQRSGYENTVNYNQLYTDILKDLQSEQYSDALRQTYTDFNYAALDNAKIFQDAIGTIPLENYESGKTGPDGMTKLFPFSSDAFGQQFAMVAKTIAAELVRDGGPKRQIFLIASGQWDLHDDTNMAAHKGLLGSLNNGLVAFSESMKLQGLNDNVTTFTISDFGRTLSSNGNGTDHAWGGNHIIMGGAVRGGQVFGQYPDTLGPLNNLDLGGRGRLVPTTSVDEYYAELALWFGISPGQLESVLPNILNFYAPGLNAPGPLGMMTLA